MTRWAEFVGALMLLTQLPVGRLAAGHPPPASCIWAYPVVGMMVGSIGAGVLAAGLALGLPQPLAAIWALAATTLVTGGLHEDGLADTADGFGGGRTREHKLAIMRDSRIGSFGALALLFSLAVRATALGLTPHPLSGLVIAAVLGRGAMAVPLLWLRPARADGLGAGIGGRTAAPASIALAIAAAVGVLAPVAAIAALVASLAVSLTARWNVGGYTGDILGAVEQVAECAALSSVN
jgi:adenosylcobinamide-GDP ribazoletransferase